MVTRGRIAAFAVGGVTLAAVVVFAAVVARGWWTGTGGSYAPKRPVVHTVITPSRSLFGQLVTAQADIVVDARSVDIRSVELSPEFKPFDVRTTSRTVIRGIGHAAIVRFAYELQCTSRPCLPADRERGATGFQISPSRATLRSNDGKTLHANVAWPPFGVQSRLTDADIGLSTPVIDSAFEAPAVTWRVSPDLVGGVAVALAALLVLGAGWLVVSIVLRDMRPLRTLRIPSHLTPVERALVLAEVAAARGEVPESRKALERLAVELRRRGGAMEAGEAEQLAWSERAPSEESVAQLAASVRSNGAR